MSKAYLPKKSKPISKGHESYDMIDCEEIEEVSTNPPDFGVHYFVRLKRKSLLKT